MRKGAPGAPGRSAWASPAGPGAARRPAWQAPGRACARAAPAWARPPPRPPPHPRRPAALVRPARSGPAAPWPCAAARPVPEALFDVSRNPVPCVSAYTCVDKVSARHCHTRRLSVHADFAVLCTQWRICDVSERAWRVYIGMYDCLIPGAGRVRPAPASGPGGRPRALAAPSPGRVPAWAGPGGTRRSTHPPACPAPTRRARPAAAQGSSSWVTDRGVETWMRTCWLKLMPSAGSFLPQAPRVSSTEHSQHIQPESQTPPEPRRTLKLQTRCTAQCCPGSPPP